MLTNYLNCYPDIALARVETEKRNSLIKAWEENEKTKAENKYGILQCYDLITNLLCWMFFNHLNGFSERIRTSIYLPVDNICSVTSLKKL